MSIFEIAGSKSLLNRPSTLQALINGIPADSCLPRPPSQIRLNSIMCDFNGPRGIALLFKRRSPATVFRLIIAIVVDTVKRSAGWCFPHVGEKIGVIKPSLTDSNAASAVPGKPFITTARAPGFHLSPDIVCARYYVAPRMSVLGFCHRILCSIFVVCLQACATPNPPAPIQLPAQIITKTVFQFPIVPPSFLTCDGEPMAPDAMTDSELAQWAETVRIAGADCRGKIDSLRSFVNSWPKP